MAEMLLYSTGVIKEKLMETSGKHVEGEESDEVMEELSSERGGAAVLPLASAGIGTSDPTTETRRGRDCEGKSLAAGISLCYHLFVCLLNGLCNYLITSTGNVIRLLGSLSGFGWSWFTAPLSFWEQKLGVNGQSGISNNYEDHSLNNFALLCCNFMLHAFLLFAALTCLSCCL